MMLLYTIILTAIGLSCAELQCTPGLGQACNATCPCPSALRCAADPADNLTYCMISSDLSAGDYCQNHFGICATGLVCDLADPTAPFKTCITPPTTTTTTTTTTTSTTTISTTTISTTTVSTTTITTTTISTTTISTTTSSTTVSTTTQNSSNSTTATCYTVSGAMVQAACVFPFMFQGVSHSSCTTAGGFSRPWCSTAIDTLTNHIKGFWGDCADNCPTDTINSTNSSISCPTPCKFPFIYRGVAHYACTYAGGFPDAWCSTRTGAFSQHLNGNWQNCQVGCPVEILG